MMRPVARRGRMALSTRLLLLLLPAFVLVARRPAAAQETRPETAPAASFGGEVVERPMAPPADPALSSDLAAFCAGTSSFTWTAKGKKIREKETVLDVSFETGIRSGEETNDLVRAEAHLPSGGGPFPVAVVLHHLQNEFTLERSICSMLAARGVGALLVFLPYYGERAAPGRRREVLLLSDPEISVRAFRQAVSDTRRALAVAEKLPGADPRGPALLGISLGAIVSALAAGVDGNVERLVLVLGGGDLAAIALMPSRETRGLRRLLDERGIDESGLRRLFAPIEPLRFAHRIDARRVLMIGATEDEVIPRSCTERLAATIGGTPIQWYPGGHVTAGIGHFFPIMARIGRFLLDCDGGDPGTKIRPESGR